MMAYRTTQDIRESIKPHILKQMESSEIGIEKELTEMKRQTEKYFKQLMNRLEDHSQQCLKQGKEIKQFCSDMTCTI